MSVWVIEFLFSSCEHFDRHVLKLQVAKKRKKIVRPKREIVDEWGDWKTGDLIKGKTFPLGKTVRGEIKEFHPNDRVGPAVTIFDYINGCFRVILVSEMEEERASQRRIKKKQK